MAGLPTPLDLVSGVADALLSPLQIRSSDSNLDPRPNSSGSNDVAPPWGVLENFKGTFEGTGFNLIFRPNNNPTTTTFPNPVFPRPPATPNESVLQLNLTKEKMSFGTPLGRIPNRGLGKQPDVFLNGVAYVQVAIDVTNVETGRTDGPEIPTHFENGLWMHLPATAHDSAHGESLIRMASIPHGTTINAQCLAPTSSTPGRPIIPSVNITPFVIGSTQTTLAKHFASQHADNPNTPRLPQDLSKFIAEKTITQEMLDNPNSVLRDANTGKTISKTISFTVTTESGTVEQGGGTTNISFLRGPASKATGNLAGGLTGVLLPGAALGSAALGIGPNAEAIQMHATYWIATVEHELTVPPFKLGDPPLKLSPPAPNHGAVVPKFEVKPPMEITSPKTITVESIQIQYSQTVFLNFNGFTWPHVSVATLVPTDLQTVPDAVWK